MARSVKRLVQDERLKQFSQRLNRLMLSRGWTGADLTREMQRIAPKGVEVGRHLVYTYIRGSNEPTEGNLALLAKVFGVSPETLLTPLAGDGFESPQIATATTGMDGKTRLVVDTELDAEVALQVLQLIRRGTTKAKGAA